MIRELLGAGTVFGLRLLPESFGMTIFIQPPGAFLVFALIIAVMNAIGIKTRQRQLVESGCDGNCALCSTACEERKAEPAEAVKPVEPATAVGEQKGGNQA
jgi:electron transport complex protein RnfE